MMEENLIKYMNFYANLQESSKIPMLIAANCDAGGDGAM